MPYDQVFNEHKPIKIKIVFGAAAEHDSMSLNKTLLTDPDLLNNLAGILLRFRNHKVVIAADIETMYHQVRASKSNAEALRRTYQKVMQKCAKWWYTFLMVKIHPVVRIMPSRKLEETTSTTTTHQQMRVC